VLAKVLRGDAGCELFLDTGEVVRCKPEAEQVPLSLGLLVVFIPSTCVEDRRVVDEPTAPYVSSPATPTTWTPRRASAYPAGN
jgi:hypothetical protein